MVGRRAAAERPLTADPGLYGPGSESWRLGREAMLLLGAGPRALLLQLAHPLVAEGVDQHSDFRADPWARLAGTSVMVIGHQKGRDTRENLKRNFGMPHPEGYRKALRLMKLAARFHAPVVTLIDTPGAYPGLGAEERGQSEALATNILEMAVLPTPIVTAVIGEGGSGGALAR